LFPIPRSPCVARLYAYWMTVNYRRKPYDLFTVNASSCSTSRAARKTFVTRKITRARRAISWGCRAFLGNPGHAKQTGVRQLRAGDGTMLQQEQPEDMATQGRPMQCASSSEKVFSYPWTSTGEQHAEWSPRLSGRRRWAQLQGDATRAPGLGTEPSVRIDSREAYDPKHDLEIARQEDMTGRTHIFCRGGAGGIAELRRLQNGPRTDHVASTGAWWDRRCGAWAGRFRGPARTHQRRAQDPTPWISSSGRPNMCFSRSEGG